MTSASIPRKRRIFQKTIDNNEIVYKTTKPDLPDNLNKVLFDAMESIVFINDSQVCHVKEMMKIYGNQPVLWRSIDNRLRHRRQ